MDTVANRAEEQASTAGSLPPTTELLLGIEFHRSTFHMDYIYFIPFAHQVSMANSRTKWKTRDCEISTASSELTMGLNLSIWKSKPSNGKTHYTR